MIKYKNACMQLVSPAGRFLETHDFAEGENSAVASSVSTNTTSMMSSGLTVVISSVVEVPSLSGAVVVSVAGMVVEGRGPYSTTVSNTRRSSVSPLLETCTLGKKRCINKDRSREGKRK